MSAPTTEPESGSVAPARQDALKHISDGKKAERRLGLMLVAPAAIIMVAVTGYPIVYAFWLSLQKYNLAFPDDREFVGFSNYVTVLSDSYWWQAFGVTAGITIVSVIIEFVLGLAVALVMHRTIFGRGLVRTVVLIPYGIVTVAAAPTSCPTAVRLSPNSSRRWRSSSSPRCGRPPRSWLFCCWPDSHSSRTICSRPPRSMEPVPGRGCCASRFRS